MKQTKRILCIALALALGLALLAPGVSAAGDPNAPVIVVQPNKGMSSPMLVKADGDISLQIEASLPAPGGVLSYAWYDYDWQPGDETPPLATGAQVTIHIPKSMLGEVRPGISNSAKNITFFVVVTNTYTDDEESVQTAWVKSEPVTVFAFLDAASVFLLVWTAPNLVMGGGARGVIFTVLTSPFMLFVSCTLALSSLLFSFYGFLFSSLYKLN